MCIPRLLALAALAATLCGCEAMKNDRILGERPWQPTKLSAAGPD